MIAQAKLAVLLTCYNRRDTTLECLHALSRQSILSSDDDSIDVFLLDDGSTDGTADAVLSEFPEVRLFRGDGEHYWVGGMRVVFEEAMKCDYDYYILLNDDTELEPEAFATLLEARSTLADEGHPLAIVVGSTTDQDTGRLTYGGLVRPSWWRRTNFTWVTPSDVPVEVETMNANCVLLSRSVVAMVGNLDSGFLHRMADFDYGLRARRLGCSVWIAPGYVGTCSRNADLGTWRDSSLPIGIRLQGILSPKGLPLKEWKLFVRRHAGPLWFIYWASPYLGMVVDACQVRVARTWRRNS